MNLDDLLRRLEKVRPYRGGFTALCPAHDDHNPSLSIREDHGKILLHCHAGCTPESVCAALGIEMRDLYIDAGPLPEIEATYDYTNEAGQLLYQVVRYKPKRFKQRRPDGNGGWIWNLDGTPRLLYRLAEVITKSKTRIVAEGEKDVETARKMGFVATCNSGGAGKWQDEYSEYLRGKYVAIVADADKEGREHAQKVAASLYGKAEKVRVLELPEAKDLTEWVDHGGHRDAFIQLIQSKPEWAPTVAVPDETILIKISVEGLLEREIKPRAMLLDPILPEQGLAMLYSKRGIGKTYLSLAIAAAVATGAGFLRWSAPRSRTVLYIDGELPETTLQQRVASIVAALERPLPQNALQFITPDEQQRPMPDLGTVAGQQLVEPHLSGIDLLILDNLSALCHGDENEGSDWLPMQKWILELRRRGMTVLFDHHAGKGGTQRGTSRREDLLDTVISLKHPANYQADQGLRCELHFEKTRGMLGDAAKPFEVRLEIGPDGSAIWTTRDLENVTAERAGELFEDGMSPREVAEALGISKVWAYKLRKAWRGKRGSTERE